MFLFSFLGICLLLDVVLVMCLLGCLIWVSDLLVDLLMVFVIVILSCFGVLLVVLLC